MTTTKRASIKCTCGRNNKLYCKSCSKLRMVIALKNNHDDLKLKRADGSLANPVWYSYLKYNKEDDLNKIAAKMEKKVREHADFKHSGNVLLFYINGQRSHAIKKINL